MGSLPKNPNAAAVMNREQVRAHAWNANGGAAKVIEMVIAKVIEMGYPEAVTDPMVLKQGWLDVRKVEDMQKTVAATGLNHDFSEVVMRMVTSLVSHIEAHKKTRDTKYQTTARRSHTSA